MHKWIPKIPAKSCVFSFVNLYDYMYNDIGKVKVFTDVEQKPGLNMAKTVWVEKLQTAFF